MWKEEEYRSWWISRGRGKQIRGQNWGVNWAVASHSIPLPDALKWNLQVMLVAIIKTVLLWRCLQSVLSPASDCFKVTEGRRAREMLQGTEKCRSSEKNCVITYQIHAGNTGMNLFWRVIKLAFCRIYTHVTLVTPAIINLFTAEQSYDFKFCCSFLFHILSFVHLVPCVSSSLSAVVCLCISFLCLCYSNILFNLVTTFCASFTSRLYLLAICVISHPDLLGFPWIWVPTSFICFYNFSGFVKNHSNHLSFE